MSGGGPLEFVLCQKTMFFVFTSIESHLLPRYLLLYSNKEHY